MNHRFERKAICDFGFTAVEGLIVLLVIVIIAGAGWFVLTKHKSTTPNKEFRTSKSWSKYTGESFMSYTYPGNLFSIIYPERWAQSYRTLPASTPPAPDNMQSQIVALTPPKSPKGPDGSPLPVDVLVYKSGNTADIAKNVDGGTTIQHQKSIKVNGYDALYEQTVPDTSKGQVNIPSHFTDDIYVVTNNNVSVAFIFRVNESAIPASPGVTAIPAINQSYLQPSFVNIVNSVKF